MTYSETFKLWEKSVDEKYRAEMKKIAADGDKEIKERFSLPLAFGTAGKGRGVRHGRAGRNE